MTRVLLTVNVKVIVAPTASVAVTVKVRVVPAVGLPDTVMAPVPLPVMFNPVGLVTADTTKVTGPVPPVVVIV